MDMTISNDGAGVAGGVGDVGDNGRPVACMDDAHMFDLYTFQPYDAIRRAFEADGIYLATILDAYREGCLRDDADDIFANAYQWISGEMLRAGILPKQEKTLTGSITPIWAYARWTDNHHRPRVKPDRRYYAFRGADFLSHHLIHLRIPAQRVLLSDMDDWHAVLNRWPVPPIDVQNGDNGPLEQWIDEHWNDPIELKRLQWRNNVLIPTGHEPAGNLVTYRNNTGCHDDSREGAIDSTDDLMALPNHCVQATFWWIEPDDVAQVWKPLLKRWSAPHGTPDITRAPPSNDRQCCQKREPLDTDTNQSHRTKSPQPQPSQHGIHTRVISENAPDNPTPSIPIAVR